jgi:hypothetical protein
MAKKDRVGKALEISLADQISSDPIKKAERKAMASTKVGAMMGVQVSNMGEGLTMLDKQESKAQKKGRKKVAKNLAQCAQIVSGGYLAGIYALKDVQDNI